MSVTEGNINVGDTGKKLDTVVVEQTDGTEAHREAVVITDPEKLEARAGVAEDVAVKYEYAARVFDVMAVKLLEAIEAQTVILKRIEQHLAEGSDEIFNDEEFRT